MRRTNLQAALCVILVVLGLGAGPCLAENICEMLLDINPSSASSPMNLAKLGNKVYFTADDGIHGRELWETNGTPGGTQIVADQLAGPDSSNPESLTACGNYLYYIIGGDDSDPRAGVYALNGATGTHERICSRGDAVYFSPGETRFFFQGRINDALYLCATDGTAASLRQTTLQFPYYRFVLGNTLYFMNQSGLWKSDGTDAGTHCVNGNITGTQFANLGGILMLSAAPVQYPDKLELWRSDGTELGTYMVKEMRPGWGSVPQRLTVVGNTLFFVANDGTHGRELWKSDGTSDGTVLVKDIVPGPESRKIDSLTAVGNVLFFFVWVARLNGEDPELWKSDGTEAGTVRLKQFTYSSDYDSPYQQFWFKAVDFGGILYFTTCDPTFHSCPENGVELWKSDGTEAGTRIVRDIVPGPDSSLPDSLAVLGDKLIFTADDGAFGRELWVVAPIPEHRAGTAEPWRMYR